MLYHTMLY